MFYIENEEEYVRARSLLERLFERHKEPTYNMKELEKAIIEWEEKDNPLETMNLLDNEPTEPRN